MTVLSVISYDVQKRGYSRWTASEKPVAIKEK